MYTSTVFGCSIHRVRLLHSQLLWAESIGWAGAVQRSCSEGLLKLFGWLFSSSRPNIF